MKFCPNKRERGFAPIESGFTLIELLVVIGILAILLAITLVAINPAKQFGNANDATRRAHLNAILNAINQYQADNKGQLPTGIPVSPAAAENIGTGAGNVDLCSILTPTYLSNLPSDPTAGTPTTGQIAQPCPASYNTAYTVVQSANNNRVTLSTTTTYSGTAITVTR